MSAYIILILFLNKESTALQRRILEFAQKS